MQVSTIRGFQCVPGFANLRIWYYVPVASVSVVVTQRTNLWGRKRERTTTVIVNAVIIVKVISSQ
jgi:hypothetical protein